MSATGWVIVAALPVLLAASAFFSGSETALFSLSGHARARLGRSRSASARAATTLLSETRALLVTLLMGNMVVNVAYFVLSSVVMIEAEKSGVGGAVLAALSLVSLLGVILLGEVLPKLMAARLSAGWATAVAVPMLVIHRALGPVRGALTAAVIVPLARLLAPARAADSLTTDEFDELMRVSRRDAVIDPTEQRILSQVLELASLKVRDLMVPRVDVVFYDLEDPVASLVRCVRRTRLRHLPVCRGGLDKVEGVVFARQALVNPPADAEDLRRLTRSVSFVPEQQRADRLLAEMRKTGDTFSIVVDEYGGTAGLITLEDLVEHIVGDIPGAYEASGQVDVWPLGGGAFEVDAGLMLADWSDRLPVPLPELPQGDAGDVTTLAGLVLAGLGHVAKEGDTVEVDAVRLTVLRCKGHRIVRVRVEPAASDGRGGGGGEGEGDARDGGGGAAGDAGAAGGVADGSAGPEGGTP